MCCNSSVPLTLLQFCQKDRSLQQQAAASDQTMRSQLSMPWDAGHVMAAAVWLLVLCCSTYCVAAQPSSSAAAVSQCHLLIEGGPAGNITTAAMRCTGAQADVAVHHKALVKFQAASELVTLSSSCTGTQEDPSRRCLINVCSGAVVLRDSNVSRVPHSIGDTSLDGVVCVSGSSKLEVYNSEFTQNSATALACFDQAHLMVHGSRVAYNEAQRPHLGGGVVAHDSSKAVISGRSSIHNNRASSGGGLAAWHGASLVITGSSQVYSNLAYGTGGGVVAFGISLTISENSSVHGNEAWGNGGGVMCGGNGSFVLTGSSSIYNNTAANGGGGLLVFENIMVTIAGRSSVHSNVVEIDWFGGPIGDQDEDSVIRGSGGGLQAVHNASVVVTGGSMFYNNTAAAHGGGIAASGTAKVTLIESSVFRNKARYGGGGGLHARNNATVAVSRNSRVHTNSGSDGGGLAAADNASVIVTGNSSLHNNSVGGGGGGLIALHTSSVFISGNSSVHGNTASICGGGVQASNAANVTITGGSTIYNNNVPKGSGGGMDLSDAVTAFILEGSSIHNNTCKGGMGGGISVGLPRGDEGIKVTTALGGRAAEVSGDGTPRLFRYSEAVSYAVARISNSSIANNTSTTTDGIGGGLVVATSSTATLSNGTRVVGNKAANSSGGGVAVVGKGTLRVEPGVAFVNNSVARGFVGSSIAAFGESKVDMPYRGDLTKCSAGVYLGLDVCQDGEVMQHGACTCCAPNTFSFTNASDMSGCRPCPANAKCHGGTIVDPIAGYWHSSKRSEQMHRCPLFTESCISDTGGSRCTTGYTGNLCGACQLPAYGTTSPLRCGKCMAPQTQFGLYILFCFTTVIFITVTVHMTWKDNMDDDQSVRPTDLIKVLVQFLQYVVIIGSVSVPWPPFFNLQRWFQAASAVFGPSSGQSLSLDCWLYHYIPQEPALPLAIQRTLVYFLAPVGVLVGVVALQCVCWLLWHKIACSFWRKLARKATAAATPTPFLVWRMLPITALVLAYYAYPTLLKGALGFFACLRIDRGPVQYLRPSDPPALNATQGYWILDIQQPCFAGWHLGWALGLGLPAVLLCVGLPIAMGLGLHYSRPKADVDSFKEHFGFLYRNYRSECMWWEAVWAAQTVVLTLVSVFSFPMERYLSVLGLLLVFLASAALQIFMQPYAMPELHRMHLVSTACLAATTFGALTVFAYEISATSADVLRLVVTIFVLCINVAFVIWCGFMLLPAAKPILTKLRKLAVKGWVPFAPRALAVRGRRPARRNKACGTTVWAVCLLASARRVFVMLRAGHTPGLP